MHVGCSKYVSRLLLLIGFKHCVQAGLNMLGNYADMEPADVKEGDFKVSSKWVSKC